MKPALWIAWYSMLDAVRNRLVTALVVLALPLTAAGLFLRSQQIDLQVQILKDLGLGLSSAFGLLVVVVLLLDQVFPDLERRSVYFVLTRSPSRAWYCVGRFLGIAGTLALCQLLLSGFQLLHLRLTFGRWFPELLLGGLVVTLKQSLLVAMTLPLAAVTSKIVVLSVGTLLYVGGHLFDVFRLWAEREFGVIGSTILELAALVVPDFSLFEARLLVVHELPAQAVPLALVAAYTVVLSLVYLGLAGRLLAGRDL